MRCRTARKLLSVRLDAPLAGDRAARLDDHLASCGSCALAAAQLERTWRRLGALPPARTAPDDFAAVLLAVESRRGGWPAWLAALLPSPRAIAAAAVAASVLLGLGTGVTLGRAAFDGARTRPSPDHTESLVSDAFGLLPFGSPASGLARALAGPGGLE
jgi:predicted anti-sigma-YlaC factor YlaD